MATFKLEAARMGPAMLPNGHRITVDFIDDETQDGFLATDTGYVVNQIRTAIGNHVGGWVEIDQATYDAALKKKVNPPSSPKKFRSLNAGMFQPNLAAEDAALAAATADKPDPISVPTPEQMKLPPRPRVGKLTT